MLISVTSCSVLGIYNYTGWKTIEINNYGIIKIPKNWEHVREDGLNYIYKDGNLIMAEYTMPNEYDENEFYDKYHGTYFYKDYLNEVYNTENFSSSWRLYSFEYEKKEIERYVLLFFNEVKDVNFMIWDTGVSEHTLSKIACSYRIYNTAN